MEGEPPEESSDSSAPQIEKVTGTALKLGAGLSYSLFSNYDNPKEVTSAILKVKNSSKYLKIDGDLYAGLMYLVGELSPDKELSGKEFTFLFALLNKDGLMGRFFELNVVVADEEAQDIDEGTAITALFVDGEDEDQKQRPEGKSGDEYPQIDKLVAPSEVKRGSSYEVEIHTSSDMYLTNAVLTTPNNAEAKFIPVETNPQQGVLKLQVEFDADLTLGYRLLFLWALTSEKGTGLYVPWVVVVVDDEQTDGDKDEPDGDSFVDGDADSEIDSDGDMDVETVETDGDVDILDAETDDMEDEIEIIETDGEEGGDSEIAESDIVENTELELEPELEEEVEKIPPYNIWKDHFGDSNTNQFGRDIAGGPDGVSYFIGDFYDSVTIGPDTLTSEGLSDIVIGQIDLAGNVIWSKRIGDDRVQTGGAIEVDSAGNFIITGGFSGTADFGDSILDSGDTIKKKVYLAKYESDGTLIWAKSFGDTTSTQEGKAIAIDDSDNIYIAGQFEGALNLCGTDLSASGINNDVFVAKFDVSGNCQWAKHYGDAYDQYVSSIAVLNSSRVYIYGDYYGEMNFDTAGTITATLTDLGQTEFDVYLAVLNAEDGVPMWAKGFGDSDIQNAGGMAVSNTGNVWLTGSNYGTITFDKDLTTVGDSDVFIAKITSNYAYEWSGSFGDSSTQYAGPIDIDSDGNAITIGRFTGTVNFGDNSFTNSASNSMFLLKLNSAGEHQWSAAYGISGDNIPIGLDVWNDKIIYTTGMFTAGINFSSDEIMTTNGGMDIFVAAFGY